MADSIPTIVPKGVLIVKTTTTKDGLIHIDAHDHHEGGVTCTPLGFIDENGNHVPRELAIIAGAYCAVASYVEFSVGEIIKHPQMRK